MNTGKTLHKIYSSIFILILATAAHDSTVHQGAVGESVVEASLQKIRRSGLFPDDKEFLYRIAFIETDFGAASDTFRPNYHGGIWGVDEENYEETKQLANARNPHYAHKLQLIQSEFGFDWQSTTWADLEKPFYSAVAACLYLQKNGTDIPLAESEQAQLYTGFYHRVAIRSLLDVMALLRRLRDRIGGKCRVSKKDIIFCLDGSGSVNYADFAKSKQFVWDVVGNMSLSQETTRISLIQYSDSVSIH